MAKCWGPSLFPTRLAIPEKSGAKEPVTEFIFLFRSSSSLRPKKSKAGGGKPRRCAFSAPIPSALCPPSENERGLCGLLMKDLNDVDLAKLPSSVRAKISQLDIELSEGDITEKGYWKKRNDLVSKHAESKQNNGRRRQKRFTRTENRYHSEVRHEAVQKALAEWSRDQTDQPVPKPMRRRFNGKKNVVKPKTASDSSSSDDDDDDSTTIESSVDSKKEMGIQVKDNDLKPQDKTTENEPSEDRRESPSILLIGEPESPVRIQSPEPPPRQESIQKSEAEKKPAAPPRCSSVLVEEDCKEKHSIYINTLPSKNGQEDRQEDYANTVVQPKAIKVSEKIQQLLLTLQVGGEEGNAFFEGP